MTLLRITSLTAVATLLMPLTLWSQSGKANLAVSSVKATPALTTALAGASKAASLNRVVESFDGQLISAVNATRKFDVVGRSDLEDILKEQKLGASGQVKAPSAAAPGQLAGAQYLLVTTIDDFEDSIERMDFKSLNRVGLKRKIRLGIVAKLYDSTTGKLIESANLRTDLQENRTESNAVQKDAELSDALLRQAVQETAEKVARHVADIAFPVRVLVKRDKLITINRGEGGGVAVGQVWNVFSLGEELIDPDTQESLGREEIQIGQARIESVSAKTSTAEILEDKGIERGAVLRPAQ